ncbi:STY4528 family pathogenicity island replication protein [Pseudomonas sp. B21-054]|uniref:STY4528 family pathogenicity island replication protein n=1 Tax=Pseudomonas sp. B21-054 TaxID=2895494 RepID=UPI00222EE442|nr:STY4528 family pathogenicity island replication protein [Pseudomonas sp. B21-054]UZE16038.1 STY4528 family pathogenicity island replication protein [Pseudomonas sp. B21-054]
MIGSIKGWSSAVKTSGPTPLSSVLDSALKSLHAQSAQGNGDGFLFSGNRHETVPRALLLDQRLTPLERNAWQIFRLLLNDDGVTTFPTYDQLRSYLASVPCGALASHETVAKTLTLLRLTRWLSLARRRRDARTGRVLGNLYVLHDRPLTPFEAMQIDPGYMVLVSHTLKHANKGIQRVGLAVLEEISHDPSVQTQLLPSHLQVLAVRLQQAQATDVTPDMQTEERTPEALRKLNAQSSVSEPRSKAPPDHSLRHPKPASTLSTKALKILRTGESSQAGSELILPTRFSSLTSTQQAGAKVALQQLPVELRQAVLDEWAARCREAHIRNPAGYLFGILQRALQGQFTVWAAKEQTPESSGSKPSPKQTQKTERDPAVAHAYLDELKGLLKER